MSSLNDSTDTIELYGPKGSGKRGRSGGGGGGGGGGKGNNTGKKGQRQKKPKIAPLNDDGDFASFDDVPWIVGADDPGYYFGYGSAEDIHVALSFPQLPGGLVQGANPAASKANLRNWVRLQMVAVSANSPVELPNGTQSCSAFHQMSANEWTQALLSINNMHLGAFCINNNVSAGSMWAVHGSGPGTTTMSVMRQGPFLTQE